MSKALLYQANSGLNEALGASLVGTEGNDELQGTLADDYLNGLGGDDYLKGLDGQDTLQGDKGDDYLLGGKGRDLLLGGDGDDDLSGENGSDHLKGGQGSDSLSGDYGNDFLEGGSGNDRLYGYSDNDTLDGGFGSDVLYGGDGDDILDGGAGDDYLIGGKGNDSYLFGVGSGKDIIEYDSSGGGTDRVLLGAGITADDVTLTADYTSLTLTLNGGADSLHHTYYFVNSGLGAPSIEFADGTVWSMSDIREKLFTGTDADNSIAGTFTDDVLRGLGGNDELFSDDGNDVLIGGDGNDFLIGGQGDDTFVFDAALNGAGNVDTISRYRVDADTIQLENAVFAQLDAGSLNAANFVAGINGDAVDADDYILYETGTGKLFYDADGSGAGQKVQFALIGSGSNHVELTAGEFMVV